MLGTKDEKTGGAIPVLIPSLITQPLKGIHGRLGVAAMAPCRSMMARAVSIALVLLATAINVGAQVTREYDLKAAFLYNFAQFVEWPATAFASADEPFTIGVLGEDPFGAALDGMVRNEKVKGRQLVVRRYRSVDEIKGCQILFISKSESPNAEQIVLALKGRNVLTVGETDEFASNGGVIRFLTDKDRLRLQVRINVVAARQEKLIISSKLLRAAEIVNDEGAR